MFSKVSFSFAVPAHPSFAGRTSASQTSLTVPLERFWRYAALIPAALIACGLGACGTDQPTYLADGSRGQHTTCGGGIFSMGDCYKRAAEICGPRGYQILAGGTESTPFAVAGANVNAGRAAAYGSSGRIVNRDLIAKCGKAG